ncbi:MAG: hypothetical protein HY906_00945 [Deltaproteobacteria bacterium]|nr:hypothetical protein [Deltaproteobacteria bacterium]
MARSFEEMVALGARFATHKLVEQSHTSENQGRASATELGARFPVARLDRIATLCGEVAAGGADRVVAASEKGALTLMQHEVFGEGKQWVRGLRDAAATAFDGDEAKVDDYTHGRKIGRSVPRLAQTMEAFTKLAKRDAAALAVEGFGADEIQRGEQILGRLRETDTSQEAAIKGLPPRTNDHYAKKAELYLLLKALERAARRTWPHDPARAAAFRLTLLRRGGTHVGAPAPTPTPPVTPTP